MAALWRLASSLPPLLRLHLRKQQPSLSLVGILGGWAPRLLILMLTNSLGVLERQAEWMLSCQRAIFINASPTLSVFQMERLFLALTSPTVFPLPSSLPGGAHGRSI